MDQSLVVRALSGNEPSIQGFLVEQIVSMSFQSGAVAHELQEFLLKKLQKKDQLVKLKSLILCRHICSRGNPVFRRTIAKSSDVLRNLQSFKAPEDPILADSIAVEIRKEAGLCLKSMFAAEEQRPRLRVPPKATNTNDEDDNPPYPNYSTQESAHPQQQSFQYHSATPNYSQPPQSTYSQPSQYPRDHFIQKNGMRGIGNPYFSQERSAEKSVVKSLADAASNAMSRYFSLPGNQQNPSFNRNNNFSQNTFSYPASTKSSFYQQNLSRFDSHQPQTTHSAARMPNMHFNSYGPPTMPHSDASALNSRIQVVPRGSDYRPSSYVPESGDLELRLVEDICAPGGARVVPDPDRLRAFCSRVANLDVYLVVEFLLSKMQRSNTSWQQQLRSLTVLDALVTDEFEFHTREKMLSAFSELNGLSVVEEVATSNPQCQAKAKVLMSRITNSESSPGHEPQETKHPDLLGAEERESSESSDKDSDEENNETDLLSGGGAHPSTTPSQNEKLTTSLIDLF